MAPSLDARRRKNDDGFTLIELLIVIIILGVLAAIVVFSVRGITNNSKQVACETEIGTVETAIEAFYADTNAYPATIADLHTAGNQFLREEPTGPSNISDATTVDAASGLMTPAPACP